MESRGRDGVAVGHRPHEAQKVEATWYKGLETRVSRSGKLRRLASGAHRRRRKKWMKGERPAQHGQQGSVVTMTSLPSAHILFPVHPLSRPALIPLCDNQLSLCCLSDLRQTLTNCQPLLNSRPCTWSPSSPRPILPSIEAFHFRSPQETRPHREQYSSEAVVSIAVCAQQSKVVCFPTSENTINITEKQGTGLSALLFNRLTKHIERGPKIQQ